MALYDFYYANINLNDNFFALAFKNKKTGKTPSAKTDAVPVFSHEKIESTW
ncbi:MAG: hypothetical protein ACI8V2_004083 [Candidatus Latescibacterota bacterium]|jgi:hypothetical protein